MNTADLTLNPNPGILLIGDSGTHKTFFLGTVPKIKIYDFDATMLVLRGKDIEFWRFKDAPKDSKRFNPKIGVYQWGYAYTAFLTQLNKHGEEMDKLGADAPPLGFDSLTSFGDITLNYVLRESGHDAKKPIDQGLWGFQSRLMETVIDQLSGWPCMKIWTAHIQRDTNAITGNTEKLPLTTGKFAAKVSSKFDEVYYTEVQGSGANMKFLLRTAQEGTLKHAKTPCGVPDKVNVSWDEVKKYVAPGS
jgi:hypothetical protein